MVAVLERRITGYHLSTMSNRSPIDPVADFEAMARDAFERLPETFRAMCANVSIQILDWPQQDILDHFDIRSPFGLLGLYSGISLDKKSVGDLPYGPDMVFLYRMPILAYAEDRGERVGDVVTHVLVHEIGHHFGLSDADMEALEASVPD